MPLEILPDRRDVLAIVVVVDRIGLRLAHHAGVDDVALGDQSDLGDFLLRERDQLRVGRVPQAVALEAEIFEAEAAHAGLHHLGRPRAEILHPADLHGRIVDVDPVVGKEVGLSHHQRDGEEVAIAQRRAHAGARSASADLVDQFAHRRRRDDMVARYRSHGCRRRARPRSRQSLPRAS